jgi:hypothetical protein
MQSPRYKIIFLYLQALNDRKIFLVNATSAKPTEPPASAKSKSNIFKAKEMKKSKNAIKNSKERKDEAVTKNMNDNEIYL